MKILSVVPCLMANDASSWRIWNIARLLQSKGHEVHLVQYVSTYIYERLKYEKLDLGDIPNSLVKASHLTAYINHLILLAKSNYDLVYGNGHYGTFYSVLGRLRGIDLLFDMHGGLIEEFLLNNQSNSGWKHSPKLLEYFLDRFIDLVDLRFSNKIICVSNRMIKYLHEEKGIPIKRMAYIPNGVDLDFYKSINANSTRVLKRKLNLEDKFIFGYLGSFDKWQGVENLIKAAKMMINDHEIAFIIVGGKKQGIEGNITFVPQVPRSQVINYYSICDVLVLPRFSHPATEIAAPTKFPEYTAMAKPVLISNVGEAAELVNRYNCGVVVSNGSPECLTEGINYFRRKNIKELRAMGKNSRKLAENEFSWEKIADNLVKVVENLEEK